MLDNHRCRFAPLWLSNTYRHVVLISAFGTRCASWNEVIAAEPHSCHGFEPPQPHLVTLLARAAGLGGVAAVRFARSGFKVTGRGSRPVPLSGDARPRFSRRALCCGTRPVTVTHTRRPMSVFPRGAAITRHVVPGCLLSSHFSPFCFFPFRPSICCGCRHGGR